PAVGVAAGGTAVYITGTGLDTATAVSFGNATASFFRISTNLISATSPPQGTNPATVDVTVTTPAGTSVTNSADQYTYGTPASSGPIVDGISPNQGSIRGGTNVSIYGRGF